MFALAHLGIFWVYSGALRGRRVRTGTRCFTRDDLGVVGIIRVLLGSPVSDNVIVCFLRFWSRERESVVGFFRVRVVSLGRAVG